jgi:hypothetical protein
MCLLLILYVAKHLRVSFKLLKIKRVGLNRFGNQIDDPVWLRTQLCWTNKNLLLAGSTTDYLNSVLCSLNDTKLKILFGIISKNLDLTKVKNMVFLIIFIIA